MKNCPDCMTDENAVGEGVRCAAHEIAHLRSTLSAQSAELALLRGVVRSLVSKVHAQCVDFDIGYCEGTCKDVNAIALEAEEAALASSPAPDAEWIPDPEKIKAVFDRARTAPDAGAVERVVEAARKEIWYAHAISPAWGAGGKFTSLCLCAVCAAINEMDIAAKKPDAGERPFCKNRNHKMHGLWDCPECAWDGN